MPFFQEEAQGWKRVEEWHILAGLNIFGFGFKKMFFYCGANRAASFHYYIMSHVINQFLLAPELPCKVFGLRCVELVYGFDELAVVGELGIWKGFEKAGGVADVIQKKVQEASEVGIALGPFMICVVKALVKEAETDIEPVVHVAATLFEGGAEGDVRCDGLGIGGHGVIQGG